MNTNKMTKAELLALVESLVAQSATPTRKATPKPKADARKPRLVNVAKACERGIRVNGERVVGKTFAVWHTDGDAKNRDSKRASVDGGSWLAIARDGLTPEDAATLANAWVSASPKSRKGAQITEYADAWVVAK